MNKRPALAVITASAVTGVLFAVAITASVADPGDDRATSGTTRTTKSPSTAETSRTTATPDEDDESEAPAAEPKELSIDNLVDAGDLTTIGYPVDPDASSRSEGDLQYASSPCLQQSLAGESGGPVFSGSWTGSAGFVDVTITEAKNADAANNIGFRIESDHVDDCVEGGEPVEVSEPNRTERKDGFTTWFDVVETNASGKRVGRAGIVVTGDRVAFIYVSTSGNSLDAFNALAATVLERLG